MADEVIRKCGYCKNFESCRGTTADDTPELMRCIAFEFNPEATSKTQEETEMSAMPPSAPAAPKAPAAPAAPKAPAAPAAPTAAPAAPAAPSMPVMGSEDTGAFVGGTVPPSAPAASAAPAPAATPEPQVFSTGNDELDELLNKDVTKMAAKERKEFISTLQGTLRAWEAWTQDPNLPPADKEMGDNTVACIKAAIEQAENTKAKRTPKAPAATPPVDPTLTEPVDEPAQPEPPAPAAPSAPAPAAQSAPVEAPAPAEQPQFIPAATDTNQVMENLIAMQGSLIAIIRNVPAHENAEPYLEAYSDISDAIVSLMRAGR